MPSEDIEIVALAAYLQCFIDGSATIKPSRHPRDKDRLGFIVGASSTLGREALEDLVQDSKDWGREQLSLEFRDTPYDYQDSDVWARRRKSGATSARNTEVVQPRRAPASKPGRHDPRYAGTPSETASSYTSTQDTSIFSRAAADSRDLSRLSKDTLAPSDSASQLYPPYYRPVDRDRGGGARSRPSVQQPLITSSDHKSTASADSGYGSSTSQQMAKLSISDNKRPNQSAQRQYPTSKDRYDPQPSNKAGAKSSNRKDQLYDETYH